MVETRDSKQTLEPTRPFARGQVGSERLGVESGNSTPVDVRALLNGAREAVLMLDGEAYRLRITAKEKLILTK
jgi:Hemin uptake protein hemP